MGRILVLAYGTIACLVFLPTFLYAIGFVGNLVVPKGIDSGVEGPLGQSILINVLLLGVFAIQHSVMARPGFKRWWTKIVPEPIERSSYVLLASVLLIVLFREWRPITNVIWEVESPSGVIVLQVLFFVGWGLVFTSTFLINHFDLSGMRQVFVYFRGQEYKPLEFRTTALYKYMRHPLMLGFLIAFWSTPRMTGGHLLFSLITTAYILVAIQLEERDLETCYGETYRRYRNKVPMLFPWKGDQSGDLAPALEPEESSRRQQF